MKPDDAPLWEIQPGESGKAFAAFVAYRNLPPSTRSLRHAFPTQGARRTAEGWSTRWSWSNRVRAYDSWVAAQSAQAQKDAAVQSIARQAQSMEALGSMALNVALRALQHIATNLARKDPPPTEADFPSIQEIDRLASLAVRFLPKAAEQLFTGPTQSETPEEGVRDLTDDQLIRIIRSGSGTESQA